MEIADARIYSSALSQADVQILASKIHAFKEKHQKHIYRQGM